MSFTMYLPEGCPKEQIQIHAIKDPVTSLDVFRAIMQNDMTVGHLLFGPDYKYIALFDDNGLLKNDPISTVEINKNILHGPVCIICNGKDENDEDWHGLTDEDVQYLKGKLNVLDGKLKLHRIPEPQIFTTDNDKDFFDILAMHNTVRNNENNSNWVESEAQKFDKNVRWNFQLPIYGYGKTCKQALINALNDEIRRIEFDYSDDDIEMIEIHNTVSINLDDTVEDEDV